MAYRLAPVSPLKGGEQMMKRKTGEVADQVIEAPQDAASTPQDAPETPPADVRTFTVKSSQTVSIVCGNEVLFLGEGLKQITITKTRD